MNSVNNLYVPYVVESTLKGETRHDLFSRLLQDRIIMLNSPINDQVAGLVVAQLLFLNSQSADDDIKLYISSPGGSVSAGLSVIDTMNLISADVETINFGMAASMGAMIFSSGTKGKRRMLPNATVMLHQPSGGSRGTSADIEISAQQILKVRENLYRILSENTGRNLEEISRDCDRDFYLNAEESVAYGIADSIIGRKSESSEDTADYKDVDWGSCGTGSCGS